MLNVNDPPRDEAATYRDGLWTNTAIHLDWRDRLRVLLCGQVRVSIRTETEHVIGRCASETFVAIPGPLSRLWPRRMDAASPDGAGR
jgi:hypothetical protein